MKKTIFTLSFLYFTYLFCTLHAQSQLWGLTSGGGEGFGTIFSTDAGGNNHQVHQTFTPNIQGMWLYGTLREAPNGKLYGLTYSDQLNNMGVIFEYDPATNTYTKKIDFSTATGRTPKGSLYLAANNKFYGVTYTGGANNEGVVFEYDYITNTYTKKIDLDSANGYSMAGTGSLMEAANGKLYGTATRGGTNDKGVIFEYDYVLNVYTKKIDLDSANGSVPLGGLMEAGNAKLYGMTSAGGANDKGVIFEYDYVTNTYTKKHEFNSADGRFPVGHLTEATNGKLYGLTSTGGATNDGVIFEYDYATNTFTKKIDLVQINGWGGRSLMQAANGMLYGITQYGGSSGGGTIFEYDFLTNTYTKKVEFSGTKGSSPSGALMQASNGKLYGVTSSGGIGGSANDNGVIYEYDYSTDVYTKKIDLNLGIVGSYPEGSLLQASNGKLYGLAHTGGSNGLGTIFEYDHSLNIYTKKIDFDSTFGYYPIGTLAEAPNGKLYGFANGGTMNAGVMFEYDPSVNTCIKKHEFNNADGNEPTSSLILASNGKFYGMTHLGGANNDGVIFEYDYATNTLTKKMDLNSGGSGTRPVGHLVEAPNGKLYAMTGVGDWGVDPGTIFEYDYNTNTYTQKISLSQADGRNPEGSLMLATNGKFYGVTETGGNNDDGVIFEYDYITNTYVKKFDFSLTDGRWPGGTLMESSTGKLYGMTTSGGVNNDGVLFEYDHVNNIFVKKLDFTGVNGANPFATALIETGLTTVIEGGKTDFEFTVSPNPSNGIFTLQFNKKNNDTKICVYDLLGNCVLSKNCTGKENELIDLSGMAKGTYFIRLYSDDKITAKKITLN